MSAGHTPWAVVGSPSDPELLAVQGAYLVADSLPIEDASLIAAAPDLLDALVGFVSDLTSSLQNRETMLTINHDALVKRIGQARAAIAKATTP